MRSKYITLIFLAYVRSSSSSSCYEYGVEYHGGGLNNPMVEHVTSPEDCQKLCKNRDGCNFFTWVDETSSYYPNTCWLKGSNGDPQEDSSCVSGPRACPDDGCCDQVLISSSGATVDYQWTRLGYYNYYGELDGRPTYKQWNAGNNENYLYYLEWLGVWYVNENLGENMGGLINWGDAICPDQIVEPWSFYMWGDGTSNDWEVDSTLRVTCDGGPITKTTTKTTTKSTTTKTTSRPGPDPDPCTFGSSCDGCDITTEHEGQVYCCAWDCDHGNVWVWEENGEVRCNCYH